MYCMNIALIGCDERVRIEVRREALNNLASVDAEFADLPSAVRGLELNADKTWLFIVQVGSNVDLAQLKRISGTFVGGPIIALVEADKDATMAVKAMRAGAMQVVLLPFQRADFGAALDCIAVQFGLVPARAKSIAVSGATGGCGATTIAINLSYELACAKQVKCTLMELSFRMGVLASYLAVVPRHTTSDLLFDKNVDSHALKQSLTPITDDFSILPGPYQSIEPGIIKVEDVLSLIELASHSAEVLVLDVPCTFDDLYFKSLSAADSFILVTQQKVSSIRGVQMVCEALPDLPVQIVVNHYDPKLQGFSADRLRTLLKCPGLVTVADDPMVAFAGDQGRPLRLEAPRSPALADIKKLMEGLVPQELQAELRKERPTLLNRLSNAFTTLAKV